jgi:hypothetical protein
VGDSSAEIPGSDDANGRHRWSILASR